MRIENGTIHLGKIDHFIVHFGEDVLNPLCTQMKDWPMLTNAIETATTDRAKVTCKTCLEWLHA